MRPDEWRLVVLTTGVPVLIDWPVQSAVEQ